MKLKKILSMILSLITLMGLITVPTATGTIAATTVLPQAQKNHTGVTPTSSQQSQLQSVFPGVVCFGDSLTQGINYATQGQHIKSYVRYLGELISDNLVKGYDAVNRSVNFGISGDKTAGIVARSGAVGTELSANATLGASAGSSMPLKIRLSTTKAAISWLALSNASETAYGGVNGKTQPNLTIDGVEGRVGYVGSTLSFIRNSAGQAKTWSAGTKVTYEFTNSYSNYIPVIFMGYNDGPEWCLNNYNQYKTYLQSMIDKYNAGKTKKSYVIIVPHFTDRCYLPDARTWLDQYSPDTINKIKTLEANIVRDFGADHVIKAREFMNLYGLSETGLTATAEDTKRIKAGTTPASLMNPYEAIANASGGKTCYTHFNDKGNELLARAIYQKLYDQGAFDQVIDILGLKISKSGGGGQSGGHTHVMTSVPAKSATCKDTGNIAYYYCSGCNKYFSDISGTREITYSSTVIQKSTVHTPGAAATCTSPQTCTVCGIVLNAAKGHSYGSTYSSDASGHWTTCISCGAKNTVYSHIPNVNEATATTAKYCVICQYVIEPKKQETHTHTYGTVYSSDASGHWTICTGCGAKNTVQPHIPNVTAATETTDKYCVICKYVIEEKKPQTTDEVYGDADGDGEFTIDDVSYLLNYFLFGDMSPEIYVVHQNMDYNKDGSVTIDDVSALLNYILFGTV